MPGHVGPRASPQCRPAPRSAPHQTSHQPCECRCSVEGGAGWVSERTNSVKTINTSTKSTQAPACLNCWQQSNAAGKNGPCEGAAPSVAHTESIQPLAVTTGSHRCPPPTHLMILRPAPHQAYPRNHRALVPGGTMVPGSGVRIAD
jgi:hypothetical protein